MRISDWSSDVCSSDLVLQRAQTGRVGGTDVDGQIIRQGRHVAHARRIISYPVRRVLVGPDIDAGEAALRAMALQAGNGGGLPPIVEAHAVDDGAIFHQAEPARAGVAQLRPRRQRAKLGKAKTKTVTP